MPNAPLVQPLDPSEMHPSPVPTAPDAQPPNTADAVQEEEPQEQPAANLPTVPKAIIKIPAFQALFAGAPPAMSYHIKGMEDRDEKKLIAEHKDFLQKAGVQVYRSLSGERGVMFNALHIHPQDLYAADKAGKLDQIAPDFDTVNHAIGKSGLSNPVLQVSNVPQGPPTARSASIAPQSGALDALAQRITGAGTPSPGQTPPIAPSLPASVQKRLLAERNANLSPGAPTSGPAPGQGRILNSILKPVA